MRWLRGRRHDQDIQDQIRAHLEEATEEFLRQGLSPEEARRAARLSFGSIVQVEEACRDARGRWFQDLSKDVVHGLRMLRRDPAFAAIAIVSLAVGIAANSAVFTIVNSLLLRPRAIADPEQVVQLYTGEPAHPYDACSYPSYVELRDRNGVFSGLAASGTWQFRLGDPNQVEYVWGEVVSGNYFDVLGVAAERGRTFSADEDVASGSAPVVVIGHGLWKRRFNADPNLIGHTATINGQKLTVVGIAPPRYTGMMGGVASELWVPLMTLPLLEPTKGGARLSRSSRWLIMVGRLKPQTTIEQARTRFRLLSREMQAAYPTEWVSQQEVSGGVPERFVSVLRERDTRLDPEAQLDTFAVIGLVLVIVNLVMAIACMNLAGMLLARSVVRRREIAVRLAVGAGRFRIVRQLIVESTLLSLVAGALGLVMSLWLLGLILANLPALPEGLRLALDIRLDWRVVMYTVAFATVTGVLFGLFPALQSSRTDVSTVLKDDAAAFAYRKSRLRSALVVAQVAFALLLLIGAGLVLRSLEKARPMRLGFSSENAVVASIDLDPTRYNRGRSQLFYRELSERLSSMPGVRAVSLVDNMPGDFLNRRLRGVEIEGYQSDPVEIDMAIVGPHYFSNLNTPIVEGRDFDERDRAGRPCVAIVNEAFRRRYFSTVDSPLGMHLVKFESDIPKQPCEIVGVARDDRWQSLQKEIRPFYWLALQQSYRTRVSVLVGTTGNPANHLGDVRRALQELDPNMPLGDLQTLHESVGALIYPFQLLGFLLGGSGIVAMLLATIGIYGLVAYAVAQRKREVGIRMALGALRGEIVRMVVGQGMALVAWGLLLGLVLSFALTRVLTSSLFAKELLFGVSATDSLTFAAVTMLLALVALAACAVPALRSSRVDPVVALRCE